MSSIEPRLNPSQGGSSAPGGAVSAARGANGGDEHGHGRDGGGSNGHTKAGANGGANGATVTVAAGVESALAAVQQQLARQAATITLAPPAAPPAAPPVPARSAAPVLIPAPAPAPVVAPEPPRPAPPPPTERTDTVVVPVRERRTPDDLEDSRDLEDDEYYWAETRPRRVRPVVDPDDLTKDERRALGKLQARKVRRIIRHVSPWSVFKVSILFYVSLWLILMVAGVILWKVGQEAGVLTNVEKFYAKAAGEKVFEIDGRRVFRAASAAGVILVFAGTGFTVLLAVLFNLITDMTGGIRVSVLELESTRRVLRRGARADRLQAKAAAAELDAGDGSADATDDTSEVAAADADGALTAGSRARRGSARGGGAVTSTSAGAAVRPSTTSRPPIEFAADAIVDGRGELESSSPALPSRSATGSAGADDDTAFAPEH